MRALEFQKIKLTAWIVLGLIIVGCARAPLKDSKNLMRLSKSPEQLKDDLNFKNFVEGLTKNIERLKELDPEEELKFGPRKISRGEYLFSLQNLKEYVDQNGFENMDSYIKERFEFYEVYGRKDWGEVFITSYYEPLIPGSPRKTKKLTQPIYRMPKDMVIVNLGEFVKTLPQLSPIKDVVLEQKSRATVIRGRLYEEENVKKVVPYFDRKEIDVDESIDKRNRQILAYVDPIDAFFLHIQGSGAIQMPKGKVLRVGYEAQNGHPYVAIGKFMTDYIPIEKMSLQKIEEYLRSLPEGEMQEYLNKNPSYVFFRKLDSRGVTYFGTEVVDGRTIATDYGLFPKGTLAYLSYQKPVFEGEEKEEPAYWLPQDRFVFDQDTGGAIRGPDRVDLFWGQGPEARKVAGVMKKTGRLVYLVPKDLPSPTANQAQREP